MILRWTSLLRAALLASWFFLGSCSIAKESAVPNDDKHDLDQANYLLAQGKYNDAILLYDDIIQRDRKNYLSYYKRALAYLGLSRYHAALSDLKSVLELQPDFSAALVQRGKVLAWQGDLANAIKDLQKAQKQDELLHTYRETVQLVEEAQSAEKRADFEKCAESAGLALKIATGYSTLWQLRARCSLFRGDTESAVRDLAQASKLVTTPEVDIRLSDLLFYSLNDVTSALNAIKKCLHQDPENKICKRRFRTLKNSSKSLSQLQTAVDGENWQSAIDVLINDGFLDEIKSAYDRLKEDHLLPSKSPSRLLAQLEEWACQSYTRLRKSDFAGPHCNAALDMNNESIPALLAKAQILLNSESYDEAISLLNKANEITGGQNHEVRQQLDRAQRLLRQSKKRDYYKILGVPRDADSKAIRKAYRDLSKKYHPDKYRGDLGPDAVSRKMAEINSAYEVLSNEELRTRYDNGDDPNDHEGQQGYPGNPFVFTHGGQNFFFQQGGHPFQGGNFKFRFGGF